jgi:Na+/H+-translocating membrane pyrophosphatase
LISFLTGVIIAGIPITISSSNSGSAWDNSKKIIETEDNVQIITESLIEHEEVNKIKDDDEEEENDNLGFNINLPKIKMGRSMDKKRRQSLKNAIIGDNIGDAFKDIAGPAINILIKFSSYFSLIIINFLNIK